MPGHLPDTLVPRQSRLAALSLLAATFFCAFLFTGPAAAQTQDSDDPCPALEDILAGKTPDDLSLVQADIDRYTLCAKRAELLKKLNEITVENEAAVNNGAGNTNPGMMLAPPGTAPMPAVPAMPPLPAGAVPAQGGAPLPTDDGNWKIVEIFGASGKLQAKLEKSDGSVARAKAGTELPDGAKVVAITSVHVTVHNADGDTELSWKE